MKRFIKYSIFIVIIGAVVIILNNIYTVNKTEYINSWSDSSTVSCFYNEPKNSLNVLVFGTSTNSNGVQPAVIWKEQQITSYNLSTERQYSLAAYYLLMESLKYQHPDVVIINARWIINKYETSDGDVEIDCDSAALHLTLDNMPLSDVKIRAAMDIASRSEKQNALDYIFPLYFYHARDDITEGDFDLSYLSQQHVLKGSCIHLNANEVSLGSPSIGENDISDPLHSDFSGLSPTYVKKMIELCKTNDINVLLLSLPIAGWDSSKHTAVQTFADAYDVSYLDMNTEEVSKEIQIDSKTDFTDGLHENVFGAYKTSSYIASYLASNFEFNRNLPDGITESFDKSYATYMDCYKMYQTISVLKNASPLESYLSLIADSEDYVVIISVRDEFSYSLTDKQKDSLHDLGLRTDYNADIFRYSYIGIIDSGNVIFEKCSPRRLEYEYETSDNTKFDVISAGFKAGNVSSVLLSKKEYSFNMRGLNIVVFSKKLGLVIDRVSFDTYAGTDAFRY